MSSPSGPYRIDLLDRADDEQALQQLADVLIDCVEGGASVSFMAPLTRDRARDFWQGVMRSAAAGERLLLVARNPDRRIDGTVQVVLAQPENQPHRGDISKMLVHRRARKQGLGAMLMRAAEGAALAAGKTLLVLDTVTGGDAERLYGRVGWQRVGEIPGYALWPTGGLCGTTLYYKALRAAA